MTRSEFTALCRTRLLRLDGATGTELAKQGMPPGVCPELWVSENPQAIIAVQTAYAAAGSDIVYAPTFGGNPVATAGAVNILSRIDDELLDDDPLE